MRKTDVNPSTIRIQQALKAVEIATKGYFKTRDKEMGLLVAEATNRLNRLVEFDLENINYIGEERST